MLPLILAVIAALVTFVWWQIKQQRHNKIFDVYSQPGLLFHVKFAIFYVLLKIYELYKLKPKYIDELERLRPLSEHEKAFDAVSFQAVNSQGFYLQGSIERRHRAKVNGLFYLVSPEHGLLRSQNLPNTNLDADMEMLQDMKSYHGGGIRLSPVESMRLWKISYNGKMIDKNNNVMDVTLEADWSSKFPYFMFDTDLSKTALARAAAKELWTEGFFKNLKKAHQTHYEQMGHLKGHLGINGKKYQLKMNAFRSHSFGHKRDWLLMHRFIFHYIYLEDNTRICVGVLSQPCITSHLEVGYVVTPQKEINPVDKCDLLLYQHGENGTTGEDVAFRIWANNKEYLIKAKTLHENEHYIGNDCEARFVSKFAEFEVNGCKGKGFAEWHYNNQTCRT